LQRIGIQIEGGEGFLLDKLISITAELGLPVLVINPLGILCFTSVTYLLFIFKSFY